MAHIVDISNTKDSENGKVLVTAQCNDQWRAGAMVKVMENNDEDSKNCKAVETTVESDNKFPDNKGPALQVPKTELEDNEVDANVNIDRGYSWVVMVACFLSNVIVDGVSYAVGIFYVEFLEAFHGDRAKTAWVSSVLIGVTLTIGEIFFILAY